MIKEILHFDERGLHSIISSVQVYILTNVAREALLKGSLVLQFLPEMNVFVHKLFLQKRCVYIKHPRLATCVEITTPSMFFLRRHLSRIHQSLEI